MKQKEVEDVFGGANEFANADSVASKWQRAWSPRLSWRASRLVINEPFLPSLQLNVPRRIATAIAHISSSCRFAVPTSR